MPYCLLMLSCGDQIELIGSENNESEEEESKKEKDKKITSENFSKLFIENQKVLKNFGTNTLKSFTISKIITPPPEFFPNLS